MMQLSLMRGFAHNLTLFGGLQSAAQYHNLSVGAGQGLGEAGALSLQLLNARDRHQQDPIDGRARSSSTAKVLIVLARSSPSPAGVIRISAMPR